MSAPRSGSWPPSTAPTARTASAARAAPRADAACELVEAVALRPTEAEERARTAEELHAMAASGLTGGHAMDANGDSLAVHTALEAEDALPLRLRIAPWCRPETDDDAVAGLVRLQGTGGALWRVAGVKLFMDGTIDNGTAWLETPDCHGESAHAHWLDPRRYTQVVTALHRAGMPTATHAIGDAAVRHVLDSVAQAQGQAQGRVEGPDAARPVRHRVEHVETVPDGTVRRFAPLGVAASMQPTHCCEFTRADHTDNWSRRLYEERAGQAFRCRDLWEAGARIVLGSDWPVAPLQALGA